MYLPSFIKWQISKKILPQAENFRLRQYFNLCFPLSLTNIFRQYRFLSIGCCIHLYDVCMKCLKLSRDEYRKTKNPIKKFKAYFRIKHYCKQLTVFSHIFYRFYKDWAYTGSFLFREICKVFNEEIRILKGETIMEKIFNTIGEELSMAYDNAIG